MASRVTIEFLHDFARMWNFCESLAELGQIVGRSYSSMYKLADKCRVNGLALKQFKTQAEQGVRKYPEVDRGWMPTPDQIRAACLEIQATWTPQEEQARRVQKNRTPELIGIEYAMTGG